MMAISLERYITVCHPFFKVSHNWSASRYLLPIFLLCISYNIPKFFELQVLQQANIVIPHYNFSFFNLTWNVCWGRKFRSLNMKVWFRKKNLRFLSSITLEPNTNLGLTYSVLPTSLRMNKTYIHCYILWSNLIFNGKSFLFLIKWVFTMILFSRSDSFHNTDISQHFCLQKTEIVAGCRSEKTE